MQTEAHKHTMEVKYIADMGVDNRPPSAPSPPEFQRWLIVDYCTGCTYQKARDVTYDKPPKELISDAK